MNKLLYILLFCLSLSCYSYGQDRMDTALYYNNLTISADSVKAWKNVKEFEYMTYLDSLLKNEKSKVKKTKPRSTPRFLKILVSSYVTKVILSSLAVLFILVILYKLFLTKGIFRKTAKSNKPNEAEVNKEIITADSDFDEMIQQALSHDNYRLAIRYQYLKTLHKLADKNIIELAADKTNYQYVRELTNKPYQNDFASLTLNYEYVWYGEFDVKETTYRKIENGFIIFNQKI